MDSFNDTIGIFPGDLIVKTVVELGLQDMKNNPWIIDDVFRILRDNPMLNAVYGEKEITRAKDFILNNNIPIFLQHRLDKQDFPCITISIGESVEDETLSTLADCSTESEVYTPKDIGKAIKYIIPPFNPTSYDKDNGILQIPEDIEESLYVSPGMILIDVKTGGGYEILEILSDNKIRIQEKADLPQKVAVVPSYQLYKARRERIISKESFNIGCHTQDPSTLIFLYSVVKYMLLRYREGLMETNNFQISSIRCTDLIRNEGFSVENVYSRWIVLSGQVEESWVKTPKRYIETVVLKNSKGPHTQGIVALGQKSPDELYEDEDELWVVIDE